MHLLIALAPGCSPSQNNYSLFIFLLIYAMLFSFCGMVVAHAPFARGAVVAQRIMLLAFAACCGAMQLPF